MTDASWVVCSNICDWVRPFRQCGYERKVIEGTLAVKPLPPLELQDIFQVNPLWSTERPLSSAWHISQTSISALIWTVTTKPVFHAHTKSIRKCQTYWHSPGSSYYYCVIEEVWVSAFACAHERWRIWITSVLLYLHVNTVCMHMHVRALCTDSMHMYALAAGALAWAHLNKVFSVNSISQPTCYYSVDRFITICPMTSASYFWGLWESKSILKIPIMSLAPFVSKHLILINGRWQQWQASRNRRADQSYYLPWCNLNVRGCSWSRSGHCPFQGTWQMCILQMQLAPSWWYDLTCWFQSESAEIKEVQIVSMHVMVFPSGC